MAFTSFLRSASVAAALAGCTALLSGCDGTGSDTNYKAYSPISPQTIALMTEKGTAKDAPMLIRAYKKESELEVWKRNSEGKYVYLKSYPMCRWSGQLGPKKTEGDRQVPEGFYSITPGQMNPNSHYYLAMNVGYPNAYDRANGRSGGSIMVHGICSSSGCFAMTDKQIEEIYAIARESFAGGQRSIQMQSYPFRMTAENLAKMRQDPNMPFWRELKKGADYFEVTKAETPVGVCNRHYMFGATPKGDARFDSFADCPPTTQDPAVTGEIAAREKRDDAAVAELVGKGTKAVRVIYADGGQNPVFQHQFSEVSRPDALAFGATEIPLEDGNKSTRAVSVQIAAAKANSKALLAKGNVLSPVMPVVAENTAFGHNAPTTVAAALAPDPVSTGSVGAVMAAPSMTPVRPAHDAAPVKTADAVVPAAFEAAPSAYAKTDGKDEAQPFYKKWLSFTEATKPETAPAVAAATLPAEAPVQAPAPTKAPHDSAKHRLAAKGPAAAPAKDVVPPARPAAPAATTPAKPQLSALPKQITGEAETTTTTSAPKGLLAWVPGFN